MIRLDIYTDNGWETLSLADNVTLRLELNSPLFESNIIPGSFTYNFEIPVNEINSKLLSCTHILAKNGKTKIYDCSYYFANKLVFKGKLLIVRTTQKVYSAQLTVNNFAVDFKDISIKDIEMDFINLGNDTSEIISTINYYAEETYPDVLCNFPSIINRTPREDNLGWAGVVNHYNISENSFYYNSISEVSINPYAISAQPYLIHVFNKIFEYLGYETKGDFFEDDFLEKLLIYSNYFLDNITSDQYVGIATGTEYTSPNYYWYNDGIFLPVDFDIDTIVSDDDNCINLTNNDYEIKIEGYHEINVSFLSKIISSNINFLGLQISLVVNGVYKETYGGYIVTNQYLSFSDNFTYYAEASEIGHKIEIKLAYNNTDKDGYAQFATKDRRLQVSPISANTLNTYQGQFYINKTLPEINISTFLNALKDLFRLGIFFSFSKKEIEFAFTKNIIIDNKYVEIDEFVNDDYEITINSIEGYYFNYIYENDDNITEPEPEIKSYNLIGSFDFITDFPTASNPNDALYLKNRNWYYIFKDGEWSYHSNNLQNYEIDSPDIEFIPNIGLYKIDRILTTYSITAPRIEQLATSEVYNTINEPGFKLLIWWGVQDYPYASCVNYDRNGNYLGDYSLIWNIPEYGIYDKYHKTWTDFIIGSEEVRIIAKLPIDKYLQIISLLEPNHENIRKIRYRGINYLPKKISALHKNNSNLIETEIIMIKRSL